MKKILLLVVILCVANLKCLYAQFDEWVDIAPTAISDNYTVQKIAFPPAFNSTTRIHGYLRGIITAQNKVDGSGAVFYTSDGGVNDASWVNSGVTFDGVVLGMQSTSDLRVVIWGEKGLLYMDGDLYGRWDQVLPPATIIENESDIVAAAFASSSTGAVTDGADIWYTTTGGERWSESFFEGNIEFTTIIDMVYAGGNTFYAIAEGGKLVKSTNIGSDWEVVALAEDEVVEFTSLVFRDEENGLIASVNGSGQGVVWRVTGGGSVVRLGSLSSPIYDLEYVTKENVYRAINQNGEVVTTVDGSFWNTAVEKPTNKSIIGLASTANNAMYAIYDDNTVGIYCPEPKADFEILETGNLAMWGFENISTGITTNNQWYFTGASMETIVSPHPGLVNFYKPGECDVRLSVTSKIPGTARDTTYSVTKSVFVETNYDWDIVTEIGYQINTAIVFPEGQNKVGFMTGAASTNTASNVYGKIVKTEDGGNTWEAVLENSDKEGVKALWNICFPTMEIGYASGIFDIEDGAKDYYIWKTEDGGESWKRLQLDANNFNYEVPGGSYTKTHGMPNKITAMAFIDENNGLIGATDRVFRTEDGGKTWLPIEFKAMQRVNAGSGYIDIMAINPTAIKYATADTVYICGGTNANVWKSVDGGKSWNAVYYSYNGDSWRDIATIPGSGKYAAFVHSDGGNMLLTEDGGENFQILTVTDYDPTLAGVAYANDSTMYAVGAPSFIAKSTDGGRDWSLQGHADAGDACQKVFCTNTGVIHVSSSKYLYHRYVPEMEAGFDYIIDEENMEITFINKSLGMLTDYLWTVNDTEFSKEFNPAQALKAEKGVEYIVKLKVWDSVDPSTAVEKAVTIKVGTDNITVNENKAQLIVFPNPVQDNLTCQFSLIQQGDVKVSLVGVNGIELFSREGKGLEVGDYSWNINVASLDRGIYFVKILIDQNEVKTEKIVK